MEPNADQIYGTLADELHAASRNRPAFRRLLQLDNTLDNPEIKRLQAESPLHLEGLPRVPLPSGAGLATRPLEEVITSRVSHRRFADAPLSAEELGAVLRLANGIRRIQGEGLDVFYQRNVPNAGNLGSTEIYPIVLNVEGIEPGIYHHDTVHGDLARLHAGDFGTWLRTRAVYQAEFARAAVVLVLTCALGRLAAKYHLRGYRLGLMDVGHVAQNIQLTCTALGLASCACGGYVDEELDRALRIDGLDTATLLVIPVGRPWQGDS